MFMKDQACFLFLGPQNEVGPSISSSVALCSFILLVYIVVLALVVYLCPSSARVVATFSGTILFPLLCSVLLCITPEPYNKKIQNDHIQYKNKIISNVWEPHTEGKNCDKRQGY
jgi:hypothetical protein